MSFFPHAFEGRVVHHDLGTMRYTVVFLPEEIAAALPLDAHPRLRMSGELDGVPISGAWQPSRGRWYLMLSKSALRDAGRRVGDTVELRFRVEDQDEVAVPEALQAALDADDRARAAWEALSAGRRRGLAHRIATAKTATTLGARLQELITALTTGGPLPGAPPRSRREPSRRTAPPG